MSFTVAFAGARDNYQVPLALYESSMLSALVTDLYSPSSRPILPFEFLKKLAFRQNPGLPSAKVHSTIAAISRLYIRPTLQRALGRGSSPRGTAGEVQRILSRAALRIAEHTNSHLFLYAGYAYEAFTSARSKSMKKVLFMYHPHIKLSSEVLARDCGHSPALAASLATLLEDCKDTTNDEELHLADLVICASTFTAQSVQHIGIPSEKIRVIPYGIDASSSPIHMTHASKPNKCDFLFIGSGIHRKGLHTLLQAWKTAAPQNAQLTVVARHIEDDIAKLLDIPNLTYIPGTTNGKLEELYRRSDVFVMPSLVEGFGYVYLEALSHGCFCIGTRNTGLPDLHLPDFAASLIQAGDTKELSDALLSAAERSKAGQIDRAQITKSTEPHTWGRFRLDITNSCKQLPTKPPPT